MPRLRTILIPVGTLAVAVAGWTAVWHWGSTRAEDLIQRWLAAEAANGRVIECQNRTSGGYPFRLEIDCAKPVVELRDETRPYRTFRFERLKVVSQIWSPGHVITEATGPLTMVSEGDPSVVTANWRLAQASAQLAIGGYDSSNSVIEQLVVQRDGQPLLRAERTEFHTRPNRTDPISVDIVANLKQALFGAQTAGPVDAELQVVARKLLRTPSRPQVLPLPQWQAAGGALDIVLLRVQQGAALGQAKGVVRLTPDGKPDGEIELRVANIDAALDATGMRASLGPLAAGALTMASRPTDIDGKPARLFNLRAADGRLQIGPLRLALPSILP
jgi:hypothetical protein